MRLVTGRSKALSDSAFRSRQLASGAPATTSSVHFQGRLSHPLQMAGED